ncbi:MAG: sigma-70 family RNA polymerase sigma factor [Blastocatellia bacterium]|nr:sigma-70 family RNA polymerase sigma factor [Blastocatellia bacterium]
MADSSPITEVEARFNAVLKEYGRFLRLTIIRYCPKDLGLQFNDIEQEARMRLWRALQSEKEIQNLTSYLYRIAVTATLDAIRRVKAKREDQLLLAEEEEEEEAGMPLRLVAGPQHAPDLLAERRQLMRKIEAALTSIPENRRRAVQLHLQGMTKQEIGELLGWTEAKARNLIYRGLQDLREHLRAEGVEYEGDQ